MNAEEQAPFVTDFDKVLETEPVDMPYTKKAEQKQKEMEHQMNILEFLEA